MFFNWASKTIMRLLWFCLLFSVIVSKNLRHFLNQWETKVKPIVTSSQRFLGACYMYLLWVLIGSLHCLSLFLQAGVITLFWDLRHSIENPSNSHWHYGLIDQSVTRSINTINWHSTIYLTLMMTSTQSVQTSVNVTNNSSFLKSD